MEQLVLTGTELKAAGIPESPAMASAIHIAAGFAATEKANVLAAITQVAQKPEAWLQDATWAGLAEQLMSLPDDTITLTKAKSYSIYGAAHIEEGARKQMDVAVQLPVAVAGALMPDAHQGYGLPIGGVLATRNAVIPYGVGVDIGCRMCLSIYDIPETHFYTNEAQYKRELIAQSLFGAGRGYKGHERAEHGVLDSSTFGMNAFVKNLQDKAWNQLGTSGGGNHFVEWGVLEMLQDGNQLEIPKGKYLALLSHSGSRGMGAAIAGHYTRIAKELCKLPKEAANLAYLDLDSEAGMEYWLAMNLAGDYASACHEIIHEKMTKAIGGQLLARVENHHNFAWKEIWNGEEVIVHRKGATPAGKGVLGIIPGSMTAPGYLVSGRGDTAALSSASHGAGRQMSRTKANQAFSRGDMKALLKASGVSLIGGGTDEAPGAYKDINEVMNAQQELVDVLARFSPKIVRMADDGSRED